MSVVRVVRKIQSIFTEVSINENEDIPSLRKCGLFSVSYSSLIFKLATYH